MLHGLSLDVYPGEIVALMGRNGSGKTTLLKCMVGLVRPVRGDIRMDGRSIAGRDVADICRQVAYLPQDPNSLLFAETVAEELAITLHNHGLMAAQRQALPTCGVAAHAGHGAARRELPRPSAGERQRSVGRHHGNARALLLDEPARAGLRPSANWRTCSRGGGQRAWRSWS